MARPKKNPELVKSEHLRIPVTAEQKQLIVDAAQRGGSEMAPWARDVLVRVAEEQMTASKKRK